MLNGGQRRPNILVHVKRGLSTASRRPTNAMMVRRAAQQAQGSMGMRSEIFAGMTAIVHGAVVS